MPDVEEQHHEMIPVENHVASPEPGLEGRRRAAAVLEVLGGAKSPIEAAEALGITLQTYYLLEARALEGLVASCEPRPRGRSGSPGNTLLALRRENDRLRQDLSRTQALARAVQRAAGLPQEQPDKGTKPVRRSRRRPRARALRAARMLGTDAATSDPSASAAQP